MKVSARVASVSLRGPASRPASWSSRAKAPRRGNRSAWTPPSPLPALSRDSVAGAPEEGREPASGTSRPLDQGRHLLTATLQVLLGLERRPQRRAHARGADPTLA